MNFTDYTTNISTHFLCALVNADYSGMEDNEITQLESFMEANNYADIISPDESDEIGFSRCEITNLYADCVSVKFYLK